MSDPHFFILQVRSPADRAAHHADLLGLWPGLTVELAASAAGGAGRISHCGVLR
jgi:hypothetical protein